MLVPKLRFKREDGTEYPEWKKLSLGSVASAKVGEKPNEVLETPSLYEYINAGTTNSGYTTSYNCEGDTVTTPSRGQGGIGYVGYQSKPFWLGSLCYKIQSCNKNITTKYIYYVLTQYSSAITDLKKVGSIPAINKDDLIQIRLPFPCLEEQQKIADFLSTVDEVIAQSEAEVQNLEQQKKATMQKIFSQEVRFKREDGTDYPEWRYARTDEIAEINPKTFDLPNRFYYMDLGSVSRGAWQEKTITDKDNAPSRANRLASVGDVFFQSVRPYNMGHFFFEEEYEYPVVASTGFIQLRATQEYYNGFIYQLLYEDRFNAEVNIRCTGSNYPAINSENFSDIEMLFPCLEEQQKIADFLSTYDEAISYAKQELDKWKELKKGLLQQMFV